MLQIGFSSFHELMDIYTFSMGVLLWITSRSHGLHVSKAFYYVSRFIQSNGEGEG